MDSFLRAQEWNKLAEKDLKSAEVLIKDLELIENTCYHCQQAAEKYLKGYLVMHRKNPTKTHDLNFLCNECIIINDNFKQIRDYCSDLTVYAIQTRYPWHIEVTERDMRDALSNVKIIQNFVHTLAPEMIHGDKPQSKPKQDYRDLFAMVPMR